jgi:SAM-dependent methyltransferase
VNTTRLLRKLVPTTVALARSPLFYPFSIASDWTIGLAARRLTGRAIPPLRYMCRTGVANNIVAPHFTYLNGGVNFWLYAFSQGWAGGDSRIVDIGSGCGKSAAALRDFDYMGERFRGHYFGFDVDAGMVRWCGRNFPAATFTFRHVEMFNSLWNPVKSAAQVRLQGCEDGTVDLVVSHSLFSHLLEDDLRTYLAESARVLRPGGVMAMTFFCVEDMAQLGLLGGRWSFEHRIGNAYVETMRYPEAAVGYHKLFIEGLARAAGFSHVEVRLPSYQSTLCAVK